MVADEAGQPDAAAGWARDGGEEADCLDLSLAFARPHAGLVRDEDVGTVIFLFVHGAIPWYPATAFVRGGRAPAPRQGPGRGVFVRAACSCPPGPAPLLPRGLHPRAAPALSRRPPA